MLKMKGCISEVDPEAQGAQGFLNLFKGKVAQRGRSYRTSQTDRTIAAAGMLCETPPLRAHSSQKLWMALASLTVRAVDLAHQPAPCLAEPSCMEENPLH